MDRLNWYLGCLFFFVFNLNALIAQNFEGIYTIKNQGVEKKLILEFNGPRHFIGSLEDGGNTFSIQGTAQNGMLEGKFLSKGTLASPFKARLSTDYLIINLLEGWTASSTLKFRRASSPMSIKLVFHELAKNLVADKKISLDQRCGEIERP